jgi:hypothetical protein
MVMLYGVYEGKFGKAHKFQADNWQLPEFLPEKHAWFHADPLAEEEGRGWMRIADWLAKKNGWNEIDPGEPSDYAKENVR